MRAGWASTGRVAQVCGRGPLCACGVPIVFAPVAAVLPLPLPARASYFGEHVLLARSPCRDRAVVTRLRLLMRRFFALSFSLPTPAPVSALPPLGCCLMFLSFIVPPSQVMGAVVDVEFDDVESVPDILNALHVKVCCPAPCVVCSCCSDLMGGHDFEGARTVASCSVRCH